MPHLKMIYTPLADDSGSVELDAASLLEHLRPIAGDDLTTGWRATSAVRLAETEISPQPWLVTLDHDAADICLAFRERVSAAADARFVVLPEAEPRRLATAPAVDALSLPLPVGVPRVLRGSEDTQRKRAAAQGVLTGLLISAMLGVLTPTGSVIRHMFDPRTPTAAVPTSILCLFFWGLTYGLNRLSRLRAIESLNGPELLPAVLAGLQDHGVERLEQALRGQGDQYTVVRFSPLLRRIWVTLEQWLIRPNLQNAYLVIEQQVISDREATQRAYNLLRIFVWATPVLGLIGTVVGISIAVGGFASFLSTNVDDISKIKAGLVGVTGGLSFAFLITLEGLLTSLVLMLFTSNVQTREERLYAEIERDVTETFLPALQRASPERDPGVAATAADVWSDAMSEAARKVIRAIESAGKRIVAKWDETHEVYVNDLTTANDLAQVTKQVLDSQAALQAAMAQLSGAGLTSVLSELNTSLQDLRPVLSNLSRPFVLQAVPAPSPAPDTPR